LHTELDNANNQLTQINIVETGYIHSVFFWLKPDVTAEEKQDFMENGLGELKKCTHLTVLFYGPPAMTRREIVITPMTLPGFAIFEIKQAMMLIRSTLYIGHL